MPLAANTASSLSQPCFASAIVGLVWSLRTVGVEGNPKSEKIAYLGGGPLIDKVHKVDKGVAASNTTS